MNQPLTLQDVKDTILRWTYSCEQIEQVEGLERFTPNFLETMFGKTKKALTIEIEKDYLLAEMAEQKLIINQKHKQPLNPL